eukprot:scaffold4419_cov416-Prasinococcus_capsulatus_cf.AAC.4
MSARRRAISRLISRRLAPSVLPSTLVLERARALGRDGFSGFRSLSSKVFVRARSRRASSTGLEPVVFKFRASSCALSSFTLFPPPLAKSSLRLSPLSARRRRSTSSVFFPDTFRFLCFNSFLSSGILRALHCSCSFALLDVATVAAAGVASKKSLSSSCIDCKSKPSELLAAGSLPDVDLGATIGILAQR